MKTGDKLALMLAAELIEPKSSATFDIERHAKDLRELFEFQNSLNVIKHLALRVADAGDEPHEFLEQLSVWAATAAIQRK